MKNVAFFVFLCSLNDPLPVSQNLLASINSSLGAMRQTQQPGAIFSVQQRMATVGERIRRLKKKENVATKFCCRFSGRLQAEERDYELRNK